MKTIQEILEEKKDSILGLEKFLYANPEIEMEEFRAKAKFVELLKKRASRRKISKGCRRPSSRAKATAKGRASGYAPSTTPCPAWDMPAGTT